jgi:hypothetical protein
MVKMKPLVPLVLFGTIALAAQPRFEYWPGAVYDPQVPTHQRVLGYQPGERISSHANLIRYLEELAAANPSRMKVFEYARSWEGRKLIYAVISSEANIRRLDEIRASMRRLADPRVTPDSEAKKIMARLPAVICLAYGVHGNEISSPDAALMTAYHLLASRKDKVVDDILANSVVLIDPTQNPDGRDRFVRHFEQSEGLEPDPNPSALEHTEPWPGGRTNHYHFDLNRDWLAFTQPETRGRIQFLQEWYPLVFVDLHEMGSDSTYYFAPEAVPYNPHLTADQRTSLEWFGRNNAKWFDQYGFSYFTREVYDAFYPGYGASWPAYYGSIAMTYEQASARGLLMRRSDNTVFHFRDTVRQHFVASVSTAETAARQREKLLENFYRYRATAIEEGLKEPIREYILPRRGDTGAVDNLVSVLTMQGVEVKRATAPFSNGGRQYETGTYVIPLAQPAKRLIRTLVDAQVDMEADFLKEQERRRRKKLPDEIYDVTAWSLPLMYNVECVAAAQPSTGSFEAVAKGSRPAGRVEGGKASVAYLVPWGSAASSRFLTAALRQGVRVHSTDKGFKQNGRSYPRGTLIVKVSENAPAIADTVTKLAAASGAEVYATSTGWVDEGVNFGSRYVNVIKKPVIALAWDTPAAAGSAGHTRFVLERQYGFPVTPVRTQVLATTDLSRFDVIILPDGGAYANTLGPNGLRRLRDWVSAGGTLIAVGGAVSAMADQRAGLLSVALENQPRAPGETPSRRPEGAQQPAGAAPQDGRAPGRLIADEKAFEAAIQADTEAPDEVPGVLVRARLDEDHWITVGAGETVHAMYNGRGIYTPVKLDRGVNAAVFLGPDRLLASGYLWEENRKQLSHKPLVIVQREGRGNVIGFTTDPNFRAYLDGMNILFLNAVFRGPAHTRPGFGAEELE